MFVFMGDGYVTLYVRIIKGYIYIKYCEVILRYGVWLFEGDIQVETWILELRGDLYTLDCVHGPIS